MTTTGTDWFVLGLAAFIVVAVLAALWLDRVRDRRSRPISEHEDSHWYRPHNGANGRGFR